jgi:GAF domain-containing protein
MPDTRDKSTANSNTTPIQRVECLLKRLPEEEDFDTLLNEVLDVAIEAAGADKGTLQRYDEREDCLKIVANRGFSHHLLKHFEILRRDINSSCAAALKRRMRVIVDDVSTSYLFVGTPELDLLGEADIAAVHSTPLIGSSGRLWGVLTTHFREPRPEGQYDPTPLDRLGVHLADHLKRSESRRSNERE